MTVEAIIVLGIAAVCCILLTNRFNLIGPVLLIAAGAGASFIPGVSEASLSPTIVLTIFLPFLLYWESLSVSLVRMKRALRGIILSATVLVIITAGIIAGVGVALGLSLGAALLIGACLGPPTRRRSRLSARASLPQAARSSNPNPSSTTEPP